MFNLTEIQKKQMKVIASPAKFVLSYGGTQSGKTWGDMYAVLCRLMQAPGSDTLVCRQVRVDLFDTIVSGVFPELMERRFPGLWDKLYKNYSKGLFRFPNRAKLWFKGLDQKSFASSLGQTGKHLGSTFFQILLNEASLTGYGSYVILCGRLSQKIPKIQNKFLIEMNPTYNKKHWAFEIFFNHRVPGEDRKLDTDKYAKILMNPADNLENLPPDYIETLEDYPERERNRLLYGQFGEGVEGGVYSDVLLKAKDDGRIVSDLKADCNFEINAVCDLGKEDATAVWICQFLYHRQKGGLVLLLDYFEETGLLVVDIVSRIQERNWVIDDIYLPHDSRNTNQTNGLSTFDVMTTIGQQQPVYKFRTHFIDKPNRIYDGINSARLLFSKCVFDKDRCEKGIEALDNYYYSFDENLGIFGKEPVKNWARHGADAFRYIALTYYEKRVPTKKPRRDPMFVYGDQVVKAFRRTGTDNGVTY